MKAFPWVTASIGAAMLGAASLGAARDEVTRVGQAIELHHAVE